MTLVNQLIKQARLKPDVLTIKPHKVREIAVHAHSLMMTSEKPTIEEIEQMIRDNQFYMCRIPVRVAA